MTGSSARAWLFSDRSRDRLAAGERRSLKHFLQQAERGTGGSRTRSRPPAPRPAASVGLPAASSRISCAIAVAALCAEAGCGRRCRASRSRSRGRAEHLPRGATSAGGRREAKDPPGGAVRFCQHGRPRARRASSLAEAMRAVTLAPTPSRSRPAPKALQPMALSPQLPRRLAARAACERRWSAGAAVPAASSRPKATDRQRLTQHDQGRLEIGNAARGRRRSGRERGFKKQSGGLKRLLGPLRPVRF